MYMLVCEITAPYTIGLLTPDASLAVLSFLAAFLLVRYKLKEATREELIAEGVKLASSPTSDTIRIKNADNDPESGGVRRAFSIAEEPSSQTPNQGRQPTLPLPQRSVTHDSIHPSTTNQHMGSMPSVEPPILSSHPHLEQVGPFSIQHISSHPNLLGKIHTLCIIFASIGFVLAIAGIVLYAWALQPIEVSVFVTACLGGAILAMVTLAM